jgi:hypothetical protein
MVGTQMTLIKLICTDYLSYRICDDLARFCVISVL